MAKRKRCINCHHGYVLRYPKQFNQFPMGVECSLNVDLPSDDDPWAGILSCSHSCDMWQEKQKKGGE